MLVIVDAAALALFAVAGATGALDLSLVVLPALLLGCVTAVGGGSLRDVLSGRTPRVFERGELYAIVAFVAAATFLACNAGGVFTHGGHGCRPRDGIRLSPGVPAFRVENGGNSLIGIAALLSEPQFMMRGQKGLDLSQEVGLALRVNGGRCSELQIWERAFWNAWVNCDRALREPSSRTISGYP